MLLFWICHFSIRESSPQTLPVRSLPILYCRFSPMWRRQSVRRYDSAKRRVLPPLKPEVFTSDDSRYSYLTTLKLSAVNVRLVH